MTRRRKPLPEPEIAPRYGEDRIPPHDLDAEAAVLSAVLVSPGAIDIAAGIVEPCHFYADSHRRIFEAAVALREAGTPTDTIQIGAWLRERGRLEQIGGTSYLTDILNSCPFVANVASYARVVHRKWRVRQVIATAQHIEAEGYLTSGDDEDGFVDRAESRMHALTRGDKASDGFTSLKTATKDAIGIWQEARKRMLAGEDVSGLGTPTGLHALDESLAGLHAGDLTILAARPAMGKSALAFQILTSIAATRRRDGSMPFGAVMFSLEMPKEQLAARALCSAAGVDLRKARLMAFDNHDWSKFMGAMANSEHMPNVLLNDKPSITLMEMRSLLRRAQSDIERAGKKLGVIVVDYIQLMRGEGDSREEAVADISRTLKTIAKELSVPVLALAQLNRGVEQRTDKRPMLSDLRESGSIEQDADNVIFIYRDEYYNPETTQERGVAELIIGKQRNGPTGIVKVGFEGQFTRFRNLERGDIGYEDRDAAE